MPASTVCPRSPSTTARSSSKRSGGGGGRRSLPMRGGHVTCMIVRRPCQASVNPLSCTHNTHLSASLLLTTKGMSRATPPGAASYPVGRPTAVWPRPPISLCSASSASGSSTAKSSVTALRATLTVTPAGRPLRDGPAALLTARTASAARGRPLNSANGWASLCRRSRLRRRRVEGRRHITAPAARIRPGPSQHDTYRHRANKPFTRAPVPPGRARGFCRRWRRRPGCRRAGELMQPSTKCGGRLRDRLEAKKGPGRRRGVREARMRQRRARARCAAPCPGGRTSLCVLTWVPSELTSMS